MTSDAAGGADQHPSTIDWPTFLGEHDMHFAELPQRWQAAPHFGNALIGSMLYQFGDVLRLQVFRSDVHDHRDDTHGWTAYSRPRFVIGHFELHTVGQLTGCDWRKDLWNAELTGTIQTDAGEIRIRHFTHAVDMAIVTDLTPTEGEAGFTWTWHPHPAKTTRPGYPTDDRSCEAYGERYGVENLSILKPWQPNPEGRLDQRGEVNVWIQDLRVSGQYATAWGEAESAGTRSFVISIANRFPQAAAADMAVNDVAQSIQADREPWIGEHRQWWHDYYRRSFVTLPDTRLESLYWQTIYRYGCTSRAGRFYVDSAGLWFQAGQWPYTTNDWNTQAAHWGVYAANRLDQGEEVVNRLHAGRENMIAAVHPEAWRNDSAYLGLATASDMASTRTGDMRYYDCVGCLPWLLHNAWWQYRFSMDDDMLREKVFPLLRRAMNLYLHLAEERDDGRIHLKPTYSPETNTWPDANFDLSLFKWGCAVLIKAVHRLGIDDPLRAKWQDVVDRLVDFHADENGFMLGAEESSHVDHRHLSHLLMIYPLYVVNIDQPGDHDVLHRSYDAVRGRSGSDDGSICELVAMLQTHAAPIGCALGRGEDALAGLEALADDLSPNGLWPCSDNPCIESSLSVADIIQNMLIQSWSDPLVDEPGPIRIFPALPSTWSDVEYQNLRAEGAFLVSARRVGGKTRYVRIESLAGEPCCVKLDEFGPMKITGSREHPFTRTAPGVYKIDLNQGEAIELLPADPPSN